MAEAAEMARTTSSPVAAPTSLLFSTGLLHLFPCLAVLLLLFLKWATRTILSLLWLHTAPIYWSPYDVSHDYHRYRSKVPRSSLYKSLRVSSYGLCRRSRACNASVMETAAECCVVCLAEMRDQDEVRELRCNHVFHRSCLDRWVEHGHATCPLCRSALASAAVTAKQTVEEAATEQMFSAADDDETEAELSEDRDIGTSELFYLMCLNGRWAG